MTSAGRGRAVEHGRRRAMARWSALWERVGKESRAEVARRTCLAEIRKSSRAPNALTERSCFGKPVPQPVLGDLAGCRVRNL